MPEYEQWKEDPEDIRMARCRRLLKENPAIAAYHFHRRYTLFRDIVLKQKFNLVDYFDRYEWQGRGSSHNHGMYWFEGTAYLDLYDEATRQEIADFWGIHVSATNPEPHRILPQGEGNPLAVDPLEVPMTFRFLSRVVNRVQRHKCTEAYCLRRPKPAVWAAIQHQQPDIARRALAGGGFKRGEIPRICRFWFPKPLRDTPALVGRPGGTYYVFEGSRNDERLNQFNRTVILGWLANIDFAPCTSEAAVTNYMGKYCTKAETKTDAYKNLGLEVVPKVSASRPLTSFAAKIMNRLIGERDWSAQEVCHILLRIPLYECSRVVQNVDCRTPDQHVRSLFVGDELQESMTVYEKYLKRPARMEGVSYYCFLVRYNFKANNPDQWHEWDWRKARERVLNYFPQYKSHENSTQFPDWCRMKLTLDHPHRRPDELRAVDGTLYATHVMAYMKCLELHEHEDDHYGTLSVDADAMDGDETDDDEEFESEYHSQEVVDEAWHELARELPQRPVSQEDVERLGNREIDVRADWSPEVGQHAADAEAFMSGEWWDTRKSEHVISLEVDDMPEEARDTLNPEQRLVYDTFMRHFELLNDPSAPDPPQLLLQLDGSGGTGKSYLIKILSAHLQKKAGSNNPVWRAAPTGVAANQIQGTTLHSLFRLPVNRAFVDLSPTDAQALQNKLRHIKYLIIDEKSMIGLRTFGNIDARLRQAFPDRKDQDMGGLSILLCGDFFQLPPVLQRPLYDDLPTKDAYELLGRNAYLAFNQTVELKQIQRQAGDDQAPFRQALQDLRAVKLSVSSWQLLCTRIQTKLSRAEIDSFRDALRVYTTHERVDGHNFEHLDLLQKPCRVVLASNTGRNAEKQPFDKAGCLPNRLHICIGARVMLTENLWPAIGLCNGSLGTVHSIAWAPGADWREEPPMVIMVAFDGYNGPVSYLRTDDGRPVVPILRITREFVVGTENCSRTQFPLVIAYAITVHKSQSITKTQIVTDISSRDFQPGLSYVAVSRVTSLGGLLFEAPFDRNYLSKPDGTPGMAMRLRDQDRRRSQFLLPCPAD
jgi:hypothetical protein